MKCIVCYPGRKMVRKNCCIINLSFPRWGTQGCFWWDNTTIKSGYFITAVSVSLSVRILAGLTKVSLPGEAAFTRNLRERPRYKPRDLNQCLVRILIPGLGSSRLRSSLVRNRELLYREHRPRSARAGISPRRLLCKFMQFLFTSGPLSI